MTGTSESLFLSRPLASCHQGGASVPSECIVLSASVGARLREVATGATAWTRAGRGIRKPSSRGRGARRNYGPLVTVHGRRCEEKHRASP